MEKLIEIESHQLNAPIIVILNRVLNDKRILCNRQFPTFANNIHYLKANKINIKTMVNVPRVAHNCLECASELIFNSNQIHLCSFYLEKWLFFMNYSFKFF